MQKREFMKTVATAGAGLLILPSGARAGKGAGGKLNIAMIGTGGRALAHMGVLSEENIVALCDVDENALASAAKKFPGAKTYVDWRICLEQKDLDAVVCCTTDFTHAFVSNWAMNRGLHVYCEKPLANSVEEARIVQATYQKNRTKLATQVGTQRHAEENFNRVRELIHDGAIGELKEVFAWGNRKIPKPGYLPAAGEPPKHLHYDLWLGPAPFHPYNPEYFKGGPGANCLQWNMYWDFGGGQIGDMGSHTMDLAWWPLDADLPISAEAKGDPFNPDVTPVMCQSHFEIPANKWRGQIRCSWYQGGAMPNSPREFIDLNKIGHGAMWKGSKGFIVGDFGSRVIMPFGKETDMTYYKPRPKEQQIPKIEHFQREWINAAKGDPTKTTCNFDYSGKKIETMLLGLVAYRVGKKIKYDGATGQTDDAEANALLKRKYRDGWTING